MIQLPTNPQSTIPSRYLASVTSLPSPFLCRALPYPGISHFQPAARNASLLCLQKDMEKRRKKLPMSKKGPEPPSHLGVRRKGHKFICRIPRPCSLSSPTIHIPIISCLVLGYRVLPHTSAPSFRRLRLHIHITAHFAALVGRLWAREVWYQPRCSWKAATLSKPPSSWAYRMRSTSPSPDSS